MLVVHQSCFCGYHTQNFIYHEIWQKLQHVVLLIKSQQSVLKASLLVNDEVIVVHCHLGNTRALYTDKTLDQFVSTRVSVVYRAGTVCIC